MKAKKALLKKKPTRRQGFMYWNAEQFAKLQTAPAARLESRGRLTWRWLGFLLEADVKVEPIRKVIRQRLMDQPTIEAELKRLTKMLVTLHRMEIVVLDPPPPKSWLDATKPAGANVEGEAAADDDEEETVEAPEAAQQIAPKPLSKEMAELLGRITLGGQARASPLAPRGIGKPSQGPQPEPYEPITATPTEKLKQLMVFRAAHPLYGLFLLNYLGKADDNEVIQILESVLEMPGSVAKAFRVPWPDQMPPGKLATEIIDPAVVTRGLASHEDMYPPADQSELPPEQRRYPIPLAQKVRMVFESEIDHAGGLFVTPVWAIGDLLEHGGDLTANFDAFVRSRDVVKQEGILFKHVLRMILLCGEFAQLTPLGIERDAWRANLAHVSAVLTAACRAVDPQSTDELLEELEEDA